MKLDPNCRCTDTGLSAIRTLPWSVDTPIELIEIDRPGAGMISTRRAGEPSFTHVQSLGHAMMAALARGVDLVIPGALAAKLDGELPPELPPWIKIRNKGSATGSFDARMHGKRL